MSFKNVRGGESGRLGVMLTLVLVGVVLFVIVIVIGLSYTPVQYGTVALVQRFGGLTGEVYEPGLHWRTPFVEQVVVVRTARQSYETSEDPASSNADWTDIPVSAQTVDGQQIDIKFTVLFRIEKENVVTVVEEIGPVREVVENVVKARSRSWARLLAQSYTAEDLYSGEGIFAYEDGVRQALRTEFAADGVTLDDFLVRKVDFDTEYINAIEQQQIAQEAIETARYQSEAAEYEKERQIRLAEAEAERTKLQAAADAERQRLLADAEAYGIETRGEVLKEYPELVQWEFVRNLEGVEWGFLPSEGIAPLVPVPSLEGQTPALPESPGEGQ